MRHFVAIVSLTVAAISCAVAQPSIGLDAGFQAGQFALKDQVTIGFEMRPTIYFNPEKKGFNVSMFGSSMITKNDPIWGYFGIAAGSRFVFKTPEDCPIQSSLTFGVGAGIQSTKPPVLDTATNRLISEAQMRGMAYVNADIPIRIGSRYRLLALQASGDFTFPQAQSIPNYRYRFIAVMQLTHFPSGVDLYSGIHCERFLANGITFGCQFANNHCSLYGVAGYSEMINQWTGGFRMQFRF